jgi:hypothetical protein
MSDAVLPSWGERLKRWWPSAPSEGPDALPVRVHGR